MGSPFCQPMADIKIGNGGDAYRQKFRGNLLTIDSNGWVGALDDIRIYDQALSQDQITRLAEVQNPPGELC